MLSAPIAAEVASPGDQAVGPPRAPPRSASRSPSVPRAGHGARARCRAGRQGRRDDVHPLSEYVHPVHRHLVDARAPRVRAITSVSVLEAAPSCVAAAASRDVGRIALKPRSACRLNRCAGSRRAARRRPRDQLRFGPRTTRDRGPAGADRRGRCTAHERRDQRSRPARSVNRSTSMSASTAASLASTPPAAPVRAPSASRHASTPSSAARSRPEAMAHVASCSRCRRS